MVFRRRMSSLRPVNRIKHVVDQQGGLTAGTIGTVGLIQSTDTPVLAQTDDCETGSTVNGIYLKVEANATSSAALANMYMYVWKDPGGNLIRPAANSVGTNDNKKFVFHQEMIMFQQQDGSNPRTLFNGVIVIPKHLRRNGPNDITEVVLLSPGVNINFCVQAHYKEFR